MPHVFYRESESRHPYDDALDAWLVGDAAHRSMAANLRYEHRVTSPRETEFDRYTRSPRTPQALQRAIHDYFVERVRPRHWPARPGDPPPDFLDRRLNGDNCIDPIVWQQEVLLVRVVDVSNSAFSGVLRRAAESDPPRFDRLSELLADDGLEAHRRIDRALSRRSPDDRRQLAGTILEAMNRDRPSNPFQPSWATTWAAFESHYRRGPRRWLEVLGLPRPDPELLPAWLMLLRYPVHLVEETLARPTQLDADWFPYHFPSPPSGPVEAGGHPMDLASDGPSSALLPEYLHAQIDHTPDHLLALEPLLEPVQAELDNVRPRHLASLRWRYPSTPGPWMPRAI